MSESVVKNIFNVFKSNKNRNKRLSKHSIQYEKKRINSEECIMKKLEEEFIVGPAKLKQMVQYFLGEFRKGLEQDDYNLAMHPSYVTKLPTGKESGKYISLDLGGIFSKKDIRYFFN